MKKAKQALARESSAAEVPTKVEAGKPQYELRLYVISSTPQSMRAVANIRRICDEHLTGRYVLEVIDLAKHPHLAEGEQIIAAPTLVKKLPLPLRRFIGDLSRTDRVLLGLDLHSL